jgi:hypothetical protein
MTGHWTPEPDDYCARVENCDRCPRPDICTCPHHNEPIANELVKDLEEANSETPTDSR